MSETGRERYRTIYQGGEGEITEKRSRFIATCVPVSTEEEALAFIERMRKKYWDARHNCFAYVIGGPGGLARCGDDGEPGGTAGRPMLEVLQGEGVRDIAVVVTRYFGGVLLGTGGLVRAYSSAVRAGLASSVLITKVPGIRLPVTTDYTGLGKIQYILGQRGLAPLEAQYTDKVEMTALVPDDDRDAVRAEITEATNGKAVFGEETPCWFAEIDGHPTVLE